MLRNLWGGALCVGIVAALLGRAEAGAPSSAYFPPVRLVVMFRDSMTGRPALGVCNLENHSMLWTSDSLGIVRINWVEPGKQMLRYWGLDRKIKRLRVDVTGGTPDTVIIRVGQLHASLKR